MVMQMQESDGESTDVYHATSRVRTDIPLTDRVQTTKESGHNQLLSWVRFRFNF